MIGTTETLRAHPALRRGATRYARTRRDEGSALIELALLMPIFLLLFVGIVDFGRAFYAANEVSSAAEAGAWYGMQQPTDIAGIQAAASLDAANIANLQATVTTGCQCSDGTSVQPNCGSVPSGCSATVVNYVQVTTNATYTPILKYPGIPSAFSLQGSARMRSAY